MIKKNKVLIWIIISVAVLIVIFFLSLMVGRYNIKAEIFFKIMFGETEQYQTERTIIAILRLPRTIMAALIGVALSLSGLIYQETFRNKLVSPDLLGVSSGAGVGAALAIIIGVSTFGISVFAFFFGVGTVILTLLLSKAFKSKSSMILLLSGIIVGGFVSSILSMLKYFAPDEAALSNITYWLMGSFSNAMMSDMYILAPIVLTCAAFLTVIRWRINIIALGREEAQTLGVNYSAYRIIIIAVATLLTASSVAFAGTISWIGLVIPHIARLVAGRDVKKSLPFTIIFGAAFMMICDILSRTFTSSEIPLSAITGFLGTPIFIAILLTKRKVVSKND